MAQQWICCWDPLRLELGEEKSCGPAAQVLYLCEQCSKKIPMNVGDISWTLYEIILGLYIWRLLMGIKNNSIILFYWLLAIPIMDCDY